MTSVAKHQESAALHWLRQASRHWRLYTLILPGLFTVYLFHYVPIYGLQIAFRNYRPSKGIWGSVWVGLEHFRHFFTYPGFWVIIINTLSVSLYSLATFPCAVILALMINEIQSHRYKRYVQLISYAPHFVSTVIVCSMVVLFTQYSNGLFNNVLAALGRPRMDFITVPRYFSSIYVWSGVWQNIGWDTIIYLAALAGVSPELLEAARIDGAGRLQIVRRVTFPCILPTVITMLILSTGRVLSVGFEKVFLLQNSLNMDASRVISTYVYEIGIQGGQFSYSAAIGLFNNVVNIAFIVIVNQVAKRLTSVGLW
ncbi:sugar ABC transporter permease [Clostridia bacterium]|nr:sugar ABC transporter permease [Clostridia bacterium]